MSHVEIEKLRVAIDQIDNQILELITQRIEFVLRVGEVKRQHDLPVTDPDRERFVLDRLSARSRPPLNDTAVRQIFERLIDVSRQLEGRHISQ